MARKKLIKDETLTALFKSYLESHCYSNIDNFKYKNFMTFVNENLNTNISYHVIYSNTILKNMILELKSEQKNENLISEISFKSLDVDNFLSKNNSVMLLKKALVNRDNYYMKTVNSLRDKFSILDEKSNKLTSDLQKIKNENFENKNILKDKQEELFKLKTDNSVLKSQNAALVDLLRSKLYPEIADELLSENNIIFKTESKSILKENVKEEIITPSTNLPKKSKVTKLFESLKVEENVNKK